MLLSRTTRRHFPSIGPYRRRSLFSLPTFRSIPGFESKRQNYREERIFPCVTPFHQLHFLYKDRWQLQRKGIICCRRWCRIISSIHTILYWFTDSKLRFGEGYARKNGGRSGIDSWVSELQGKLCQQSNLCPFQISAGNLNRFSRIYGHVSMMFPVPFFIQAVASSSTPLFKALSTTWSFQSTASTSSTTSAGGHTNDAPGPTLVSFNLTYEFSNPLHAGVSSAFFGQISKLMIEAFSDRCQSIYGPRTTSFLHDTKEYRNSWRP